MRHKFRELFSIDPKNYIIPNRDIIIEGITYPEGVVMERTEFGEMDLETQQEGYEYILENLKAGWTLTGNMFIRVGH